MTTEMVHVGFGNIMAINRVLAIVSPSSAPVKRLVQEGRSKGMIVDMTSGRRTKAVVVTDNGYILLAALSPETIAGRLQTSREAKPGDKLIE